MDDYGTDHLLIGLIPVLAAVIGVASSAAMLLAYHFVFAQWCNQRRRGSVPGQDMPGGIETSITELIPSYKYTKDIGMVSKTQDKTCAVCLCEFTDGQPVRVLPECVHPFHVPCIDMWLLSHSNCPVCRTDASPTQLTSGGCQPESDVSQLQPEIHQPREAV